MGERYGHLTIVADAGFRRFAGKNAHFWHCRCDCGREETVYQGYLVGGRTTACRVCRRGPCIICGGEIVGGGRRTNVCGPECHAEKRRRVDLKSYAKRAAEDPEYNRRRWAERKAQMIVDGTWDDYLSRDREYRARYRTDPANAERLRQQGATTYERHRDRILQQRRERWNALSQPEKREKIARAKQQGREWRQRWRDEIKQDPERYAEYLDYQREKGREHYARKALREMLDIGHRLGGLNESDTENE
jgi:hypothetical protein